MNYDDDIYTLKPQYSEQVRKNLFVHYIELFTTYIKCNMLSKSSKWELCFVYFIVNYILKKHFACIL